jgi:putative heme-binding domain-containing protein
MMRNRILNRLAIPFAGLFFFFAAVISVSQPQKTRKQATPAPASSASGERGFASNCSGCHGLDGTGSQRAPNIVSNPQVQKLSADEMHRIVSEGVPGTGMPAFKGLGKPTITAIVAYVRNLEGKNRPVALPGNPGNGKVLFFGTGQCSNCHMAGGRGGFIAPDLSTYGQTHDAEAIRAAIINPAARERPVGLVAVITASGERFEGIVRNEDNFSLQLQSTDGSFHFLSKSDVKTIDRRRGSMMPSDYGSKLSDAQLNDLVSYLLKLAQSSTPPDTHHPEED